MPEPFILLVGMLVAGAFVLLPLTRRAVPPVAPGDEAEAAALRHRVALEALRDVETDRRAGSLDDEAYAQQLAQAEERAAATRVATEQPVLEEGPARAPRGRRAGFVVAGVVGIALVTGSLVPGTGIANPTTVNQSLADAQAAEAARGDRIAELLEALAASPRDTVTLSTLADTYLAGSSQDDLVRAAASLQLLIGLEPDRADAYERIMTAYLRAGDAVNARSAHEAYAQRGTADPVEVAFFDGVIALRGENDPNAAVEAFDAFLALAPDDPRAGMIRGLRDEAAAQP